MSIASRRLLSLPPLAAAGSPDEAKEPRTRPRRLTMRSERDRIATASRRLAGLARWFDRVLAESEDEDHGDTHEQFLRHLVKPSEGELVDWRDLNARVLDRFGSDEDVSSRRHFRRLTRLVALARSFERLVSVAQRTLRASLRDADTYLASHGDEAVAAGGGGAGAAAVNLRSLSKYERLAAEFRQVLIDGQAAVQQLAAAVEARRPFVIYLADYAKVLHYMRETSERIGACAAALRQWLAADEVYIGDVGAELRQLSVRRRELAEAESRALEPDVGTTTTTMVCALASNRIRLDSRALGEAIRADARRAMELRAGLATIDEDLAVVRRELKCRAAPAMRRRRRPMRRNIVAAPCGVLTQAVANADCLAESHRSPSSGGCTFDGSAQPLDSAALRAAAARARQEEDHKADLHRRTEELSARRRLLLQSADRVQRRLRVSRSELEAKSLEATELQLQETRGRRQAAAEARSVRELDAQVAALQRILELKTSPEALREAAEGDVALSRQFDAILQDAVVKCAHAVGKFWPILYASLTFVPERSEDQIVSDIRGIQRVGERLGHSDIVMAEAALRRWAKFSKTAAAAELSFVCRKVLQPGQSCLGCAGDLVTCTRCRLPRLGRFSYTACT